MNITTNLLEEACILSDGNTNLFPSIFLLPAIKKYGYHVQYWSGYMGGELAGSHVPKKLSRNFPEAAEAFIMRESKRISQRVLPNDKLNDWIAFFISESGNNDKLSYDDQLEFYHRQERNIGNQLFFKGYNYITPFINDRWLEFILSIPHSNRLNKYLYREIMKNFSQKLFSLPVKDNFGMPMGSSVTLVKMQTLRHRIGSLIFPNFLHPNISYIDFNKELRKQSALKNVVRMNIDNLHKRQIVDYALIERLWIEHQTKKRNNCFLLMNLASLEIILKTFNVNC